MKKASIRNNLEDIMMIIAIPENNTIAKVSKNQMKLAFSKVPFGRKNLRILHKKAIENVVKQHKADLVPETQTC